MIDSRTPWEKFAEKRKIGLIAVALFIAAQSLYGYFLCPSISTGTFLKVSVFVLLPGILVFIKWQTNWGLPVYAGIVLAFCFMANGMECAPSTGGGAAMAYVIVALYGWPLGILMGVLAASVADKRDKLKNGAS
jgi:hypothetical protein